MARDCVFSNVSTVVQCNYLLPSIVAAGLDPDARPESDASAMSFGSGGSSKHKAWRDIWGCGQGVGGVDEILPAEQHIARLAREYVAAKSSLDGRFIAQDDHSDPDRKSVL